MSPKFLTDVCPTFRRTREENSATQPLKYTAYFSFIFFPQTLLMIHFNFKPHLCLKDSR